MHYDVAIEAVKARTFRGFGNDDPEGIRELKEWEAFVRGLYKSNGMTFNEADNRVKDWLVVEDRAPFVDMAKSLVDELREEKDLSDVDLIIVCHYTPDVHLGTSVTNYIMHRLGIEAMAFAISDHGTASALLGLRIAGDYLASGNKKALVIALDQNLLPYRSEELDRVKPFNAASCFLLTSSTDAKVKFKGYSFRENQLDEAGCQTLLRNGSAGSLTVTVSPRAATDASVKDLFPEPGVWDERYLCSASAWSLADWMSKGLEGNLLLVDKNHDDSVTAALFSSGAR